VGTASRAIISALFVLAAAASGTMISPRPVASQPVERDPSKAFTEVVRTWAEVNHVNGVVLVVRRDGQTLVDMAFGSATPGETVPVQSLSKAITAACVGTLIRDNKLTFNTPLSTALAHWFERHGRPMDERLLNATIEQLITHRSGLEGNEDPERAFWSVVRKHLRSHSASRADDTALLLELLKRPLPRMPGEGFAYSNVGYIVLAEVIKEISGTNYEGYCRSAVFDPMGIRSARLSPRNAIHSGAGGWEMTGADYLAFYEALFTGKIIPDSLIGPWIREQRAHTGQKDSPIWYGLGTNVREGRGGRLRFFHGGLWGWRQADAFDGPIFASEASYVARVEDGTSWLVAWRPTGEGLQRSLDQELWKAYRSVWP
jgi:CubicO group peptidase (beta-lactamase class C family)